MRERTPKGKLLVIGGGEAKGQEAEPALAQNQHSKSFEILKELIPNKSRTKKTIEIITSASSVPDEINDMYTRAFKKIGFSKVHFMFVGTNREAHNPKFITRIKKAHAVFFSGGNQFRLATILGGTGVMEIIMNRYFNDKYFVVAGTSAGAMALPEIMIYEGENNAAILNKALGMTSGLGFINHCIIDTHFGRRGRFGRLIQAVVMNPICLGIGVGEDTALIIEKGNHAVCIGAGMVIIIDGKAIGHTNISYADKEEALCIENLKVHILSSGNGFLLKERKFIPSKKDLKREEEIGKKALIVPDLKSKKKKTEEK